MSNRILVFYGSYRSDRTGIRLAEYVVDQLRRRGDDAELIDAKAIDLPMLDRMYKEYPKGHGPAALEQLAQKIKAADGFIFVAGEYNWGVRPGLKNLTDHFGTLSEMGVLVISSTIAVGPMGRALSAENQPTGEGGKALWMSFPRDDLMWWVEAGKAQRPQATTVLNLRKPSIQAQRGTS